MTAPSTPERKRRPRRIAADEAHSWARNLRLGNPFAKLVLSMLTIYVNGDGACFVGIEQLAEDTELSMDTVRKRLAWLERIGVVVRFPQWLDASGRRNSDGKGRRTSDEIRLLIDADIDEIEANAKGDGDGVGSPSHQQGHDSGQDSVSPPVALCQPSDSGKGLISEPEPEEKEDSPLTPQGGCELQQIPDQGSEARQWPHAESWSQFELAWQEPILRQSIARNVWSGLTDDEQAAAIKAAKGYVLHRKAQKKPPNVIGAHTFLRERDAWPGYAKLVPPDPMRVNKLLCGTDEWRALQVIRRIAGFAPMSVDAPFSGEVPAGAAALAPYFSEGMSETENWLVLEAKQDNGRDDKRYIAWRQRAHEWLRLWIEPERIYTEPKGSETGVLRMPDGSERRYRKFVMGLLVPREWPPAKHGEGSTGPPTHPPQSLMTDDDHAVMAGERR